MIDFKSRVRYNVIKGNDKIKTGEKFIIYNKSEYDGNYIGYTIYVYHRNFDTDSVEDRDCFQFWEENTEYYKEILSEKLKVFESMLECLEIEPDKEYGQKLISELQLEIENIKDGYSIEYEKPDYFVCISPTKEERNKRRTEVTTLE